MVTYRPTMNFPLNPPVPISNSSVKFPLREIQAGIFGSQNLAKVVDSQWSPTLKYLLLRAEDGFDLRSLAPNHSRLAEVATKRQISLVIVTGRAVFPRDGVHFNVRVFAVWYGAIEDPVCGSAFTVSTPYWAGVYEREDKVRLTTLFAYHASPRSGIIRTELLPCGERILISGSVNKFCSGVMNV